MSQASKTSAVDNLYTSPSSPLPTPVTFGQSQPSMVYMLSYSVTSDSLRLHGLQPTSLCPWDFSGKNTGAGCHFLFQRIFLTQGIPASPALAGIFFTTEPQPNTENPPSPSPLLVSVIRHNSLSYFPKSFQFGLSAILHTQPSTLSLFTKQLSISWASDYMASPAVPFGEDVYPTLPSVPRDQMMWLAYFSSLKWFPDLSRQFLDKDLTSGLMKSTFTSLCLNLITVFYPHVKEFRSPYMLNFTAPATTIILSDSTSGRRNHENYSPPGPWPA